MKKRIVSAFVMLGVLLGLTGYAMAHGNDKVELTMYLWDKRETRELTPWLEKQFPDIDFTFVVGYNTMDYYMDLNDKGMLPDMITCRRFSLNDAAHLSEYLMDLSETDVVGSYYDSYIGNNRETEGAIRWLPLCAEVDGYIANLDLFEANRIPVPTNEAEFAQACRQFEELGIRGYTNDYLMDYSCMEALQGCAIPELMSMEGSLWRAHYESGQTDSGRISTDVVWRHVFDQFEQYMADTRVTQADADVTFEMMRDAFLEEKTAIMRGTAADCIALREQGIDAVMLPYFGETAEDNWLLTYPVFQLAVNRSVEEDPEKNDAVQRVLAAILSEEGQRCVAAGNSVLSYNKNVNFEMNEAFSQVKDCISSNHMYMRLASTEMFAISRNVVQKLISGEYDIAAAYDDFAAQLKGEKLVEENEYRTKQKTGYAYAFGKHGSPAASAVLNTLRRQSKSDLAIGYSGIVTMDVYVGDYNYDQINRLMDSNVQLMTGTLTGADVKNVMEWLVNKNEDGASPIRHKNLIPVTSGMEYKLKDLGDGTYELKRLTIEGKPIEDSKMYTIALFGEPYYIENPAYCNCSMPEQLKEKLQLQEDNVYTMFRAALENDKQLEAPTDYVQLVN